MKRKTILASIGVVLLCLFVSCSKYPVEEKGQQRSGIEVNLKIFCADRRFADNLGEIATVYESENPDIKVTIDGADDGENYIQLLKNEFISGDAPAIFNVNGLSQMEEMSGNLLDLTSHPLATSILHGYEKAVAKNGKLYGLPTSCKVSGFIYNAEIFSLAGIDTTKIVDFKSFEQTVIALDEKIKLGELRENFPELKAVFDSRDSFEATLNAAISIDFGDVESVHKSKVFPLQAEKALKKIVDLQVKYSVTGSDSKTSAIEELASERVAIIAESSDVADRLQLLSATVGDKTAIFPIFVNKHIRESVANGATNYWGVNKNADALIRKAALNFLEWLYQNETAKKFITDQCNLIPPYKGFEEIVPATALGRGALKYIEEKKTFEHLLTASPSDWLNIKAPSVFKQYLTGQDSWKAFTKKIKSNWEQTR